MGINYFSDKSIIVYTILLLMIISFFTFAGSLLDATDVKDYSDTAKFFAGEYKAKQRASHSVLYGLLLSPYIKLTNSYFFLKFSSAFFLILILLSVYYISNKNRKTLLLMVLSPLFWYMSPWVSPLPLTALLFLWGWFFIKKFNKSEKIKNLIYSGLLIGLAGAFWDTAFYFSFIFLLAFLYDKKFYHSVIFILMVIVGMIPNFIIDYMLFGFPFYSKLKHFSAVIAFELFGGIYGQGFPSDMLSKLFVLFFVPWFLIIFLNKKRFLKDKKTLIFLIISVLFILTNSQIRLLLVIIPIMILLLGENLNKKQIKIQLMIFIILSLLVILPYALQITHETNAVYLRPALANIGNWSISNFSYLDMKKDFSDIEKEFPKQRFIVFGKDDDYRDLAHYYWGEGIKEFISVQDYKLYLKGDNEISSKEISSDAGNYFRREIFFSVGLRKNKNDKTDYENIKYGLSFSKNSDFNNFKLKKSYKKLSLFEKI